MKVLLCSSGSRGDIQPTIALAIELRAQRHSASLCVMSEYKEWVESFGIDCFSIGRTLKRSIEPSAEQVRHFVAYVVHDQFPAVAEAACGCDLIIAAGTQFATRSVAEVLRIPYLFAAYCPAVLPSLDHPPPQIGARQHPQSLPASRIAALWEEEEHRWNELFSDALNEERARAGLAPIASMLRHIFTERPWLAADAALAPAAEATNIHVEQTGAWFLTDSNSIPDYVEEFLADGEPPVYFDFGSMPAHFGSTPASEDTSRVLIEAARALGLRSILAQGRGNLRPIDGGSDCLSIGDIAHEMLLPRVAAVVHHGGAGTTTAAARAGKAQIIVPHIYDQFYWAHRVQQLGIGVAGPLRSDLDVPSIAAALRECMRAEIGARAQVLASRIERHGTKMAASRLVERFQNS